MATVWQVWKMQGWGSCGEWAKASLSSEVGIPAEKFLRSHCVRLKMWSLSCSGDVRILEMQKARDIHQGELHTLMCSLTKGEFMCATHSGATQACWGPVNYKSNILDMELQNFIFVLLNFGFGLLVWSFLAMHWLFQFEIGDNVSKTACCVNGN